MNTHPPPHRDYGFVVGLAAGTVVGVGLAMWLAPRSASELGERITDSTRNIGRRASDYYEHASSRVGEAVETLTRPRAL